MLRRRLRRILTAAAALTLLGAGLAVTLPANAAITSYQDGFEGNAHVQWSSVELRGSSLVFFNNTIMRRSGTNAAWLIAGPTASEAARIYRRIRLDQPTAPFDCFGSLYMRKAGGQRNAQPSATVTVHLRPNSIVAPPSWTKVFTVSDGSSYQLFSLGVYPYMSQFYVDISSVNDVTIDDLSFECRTGIE
jgi:hypothetical protein